MSKNKYAIAILDPLDAKNRIYTVNAKNKSKAIYMALKKYCIDTGRQTDWISNLKNKKYKYIVDICNKYDLFISDVVNITKFSYIRSIISVSILSAFY